MQSMLIWSSSIFQMRSRVWKWAWLIMDPMALKNSMKGKWKLLWCWDAFICACSLNTRSRSQVSRWSGLLSAVWLHRLHSAEMTLICFNTGHYISAMVMDFRHGSTALLTTSKRFKMPESLEEIPLLLPHVLKLLYNCSLITRSTVASIKLSTNTFNEDEEGHFLPPCFRPVEKSDKKRKRWRIGEYKDKFILHTFIIPFYASFSSEISFKCRLYISFA